MAANIESITTDRLAEYARVPMVCDVRSVLAVEELDGGIGGLQLREVSLETPYVKDYDADRGGGPIQWPLEFDLSRWGFWIAREGGEIIGAAAVAWDTPGIHELAGRPDLAVLWDIRVRPAHRRRGVGAALFREAARGAAANGCSLLKIETQNVNVPACRFYSRMGCYLGEIDRLAYVLHPHVAQEVKLSWYKGLSPDDPQPRNPLTPSPSH